MAMIVGWLGSAQVTCAQTSENASASQDVNPFPNNQDTGEENIIYQRGPDGQMNAVPVAEGSLPTIDDVLKSAAKSDPPVPDYFISRLTLDGRVVENWAEMIAEVEVRVVADDRWLRVPLRFDQALLLQYVHQGDGDAAPSAADDAGAGLTWMLRGQGVHTLSLTLRVPLRKVTNGSQLQLVVPELSHLFAGELQLRLPGDQLRIQPGEDVHILGEPRKVDGETIVTATLAGDRVDLRWHPVVEEANPISQTLTHLTLRLRDERVLLSAGQEVRLRQSGTRSVEVRMPAAPFELNAPVRISDTSGAEWQVRPVPTERAGWVQVPLEEVIGTAVKFDWSFEMPFDASVNELTVDGLEVAGAADQSGTISLEGFDRHVLTRQATSGGGVSRISVDQLPAAGAFANLAYEFQAGSYRLVLDVGPRESTFRVKPIYVLHLSELQADLTAWFLVSLDEGQVDALSLKWPRFAEQGWDIEPVAVGGGEVRRDEVSGPESSNDETGTPNVAEVSPPTRWLLKPTRPLENGGEIALSAARRNPLADMSRPLQIVLPQVGEGRMLPAVLIVTMSDNIQATVAPLPGLTLTSQKTLPLVPASILEGLEDRSRLSYDLKREDPNAALAIDVKMTVQPRQIHMGSVVTVEQVDTDPRVTQTIDVDVSFGRLSSLMLDVPPQLEAAFGDMPDEARSEALRFRLGSEMLPASSVNWDESQVELVLPAAMRGSFQVTIGPYTTPILQRRAASVDIPIVGRAETTFDSLKLVIPDLETVAVSIPDPQWTHLLTIADGAEWTTRSSPDSVTLNLDQSRQAIPQQMTIPLAVLRSQISEIGVVSTVAQYLMDERCSQVVVDLPADAEQTHFEWNGRPVQAPDLTQQEGIAHQFLVERPDEAGTAKSWLRVSYVIGREPLGWSRRNSIPFPRFGDGVAIARTVCEVKLPRSQHLLTRSKVLSPLYTWTREAFVWSRVPEHEYRDFRAELTAQGATREFSVDASNVYPFETFGALTEVTVRSMSDSLLVFLGAGLTLVASFLVLKVPLARSLWFWLFWGTLAAVLSLWHLEAIILLLQPAAYGLILPICAALFEWVTDRKTVTPDPLSTRRNFELTMPAKEDSQPSVGSSIDPSMPSTLVRPTALSDSGVR